MVDSNLLIKNTKSIEIYQDEVILRDEKSQDVLSM